MGNSREAQQIRNAYLQMLVIPQEVNKRTLKERPYLAEKIKPGKQY